MKLHSEICQLFGNTQMSLWSESTIVISVTSSVLTVMVVLLRSLLLFDKLSVITMFEFDKTFLVLTSSFGLWETFWSWVKYDFLVFYQKWFFCYFFPVLVFKWSIYLSSEFMSSVLSSLSSFFLWVFTIQLYSLLYYKKLLQSNRFTSSHFCLEIFQLVTLVQISIIIGMQGS